MMFFRLHFFIFIALFCSPLSLRAEVEAARFHLGALCCGGINTAYDNDFRSLLLALEMRSHLDPDDNAWTWLSEKEIDKAPPFLWIFVLPNALISDELGQSLRRYLASGGTLMVEGNGPASFGAIEKLRQSVFPGKESKQISEDALLTRTFYILPKATSASLQTIRSSGRVVWVESLNPLLGGISLAQMDREMRMRACINVVLYALTGSYKDDLTHLRYLMRRRKS